MASGARFVWNPSGYHAVLGGPAVQSRLDSWAEAVAGAAESATASHYRPDDEGHYASGTFRTKSGDRGRYVRTDSYLACLDCSRNKTLTKAFNANK